MYFGNENWQIRNLLTKMVLVASLVFSFFVFMAPSASAATVVTYPSHFGTSSTYSLKVDSTSIRVARQFDYSFAQFSYSGTATFKVTASEAITSYNISPHSYGIEATVSGKDLTFTLPQAGSRYLVIKINNLENLVIMADPLETDRPSPNGGSVKSIMDYPNVDNTGGTLMTSIIQQAINDANARSGGGTVYFPSGIYKFSQLEMKSNVTLYLAAGAVLRGSSDINDYDFSGDVFPAANIRIVGKSNVAIKGRGMIDSNGTTLTTGDSGPNRENIISSSKSGGGTKPNNLTFEGITLRDGTTWNFRIQDATNVNIKNVKIINNVHWIHGDGYDLVNTSHAVVDHSFAYTGDDVFDAKSSSEEPMTDVVYKNSVAFTESAGTKVGMQGQASVSDIWFKNIDVIQGYRGVSVDHDQGNGVWDGIHFIDIRTEKIHNNGTSGQFRTAPILIWTAKYGGSEVGPVSNVELTRVSFENINNFHSFIQGYDSSSKVSNVSITDLKMNGNLITNASQGLIDIGDNASNINFDTSDSYKLSSAKSGKLADVHGGSLADGTEVIQWTDNGDLNQKWKLIDVGDGYYKLKNEKSGKIMDVTNGSTANGAAVIQWPDNDGENQQWKVVDVGGGYSKLVNRKSGKVLDVDDGSTSNGAQLIQWTDNGGDNQKWKLIEQ